MELTKSNFDNAVSPVVGVILMVAVTVILAAVIGTFVLDLGNNVQENPQAGVTFDEDTANNEITVQLISMENADDVYVRDSNDSNAPYTLSSVGDSATVSTGGASGQVTVVGELDGKEAVLQTYDYDHS